MGSGTKAVRLNCIRVHLCLQDAMDEEDQDQEDQEEEKEDEEDKDKDEPDQIPEEFVFEAEVRRHAMSCWTDK